MLRDFTYFWLSLVLDVSSFCSIWRNFSNGEFLVLLFRPLPDDWSSCWIEPPNEDTPVNNHNVLWSIILERQISPKLFHTTVITYWMIYFIWGVTFVHTLCVNAIKMVMPRRILSLKWLSRFKQTFINDSPFQIFKWIQINHPFIMCWSLRSSKKIVGVNSSFVSILLTLSLPLKEQTMPDRFNWSIMKTVFQ